VLAVYDEAQAEPPRPDDGPEPTADLLPPSMPLSFGDLIPIDGAMVVLDLRMGERLEYRDPTDIRELIKANAPERKAGELLKLTAEERWACRILTMECVEEPREARQQRVRSEKLDRDRERRRRERLVAGCTPRGPWAASAEREKPWVAEGVSRRTWYRRQKVAKACGTVRRARYLSFFDSGRRVVPSG